MSAPLLALATSAAVDDSSGGSSHQNGDVLARLFARAALECPRDDVALLAATRALEAARDAIYAGGGVSPASAAVAAAAAGVIASRDGGGGDRAVPNAVDVDAVVGSIVGAAAEPRAASAALAAVRETLALERTPGNPSAKNVSHGDDRGGSNASNVALAFLRAHGAAAAAGTRARCALAAAAAAAGDDRARGDHSRAAAEGLKLFAAAVTKLASSSRREASSGEDCAVSAAVSVFLPLAMDAGAGVAGDERRAAHPPVPELRAAAAALVRMAAAAAPEGFRTAVAALGSESRSRLQSALASSSPGGVATTPGGVAAPGTPPAISLGSMG